MRELTDRERRTIRLAGVGLGIYLVLFVGVKTVSWLEGKRAARAELGRELAAARLELLVEQRKQLLLESLRAGWGLDLARMSLPTVVGDARVAIETAARACRVGLGFAKESAGRRRAHELAAFQVSGSGADAAVAKFIHRMTHLGYPFVLDNVELEAAGKPGSVRFSFSVALIDYATWTPGTEA